MSKNQSQINKVAIVGAGAWGTALANVFAKNQQIDQVAIWSRNLEVINDINNNSQNSQYLPEIQLENKIQASEKLEQVIENAALIFMVLPAQKTREILEKIATISQNAKIICCSKGIEIATKKFMFELYAEFFPKNQLFTLSGPNFADEVAKGQPAATSLSGFDFRATKEMAHLLSSKELRFYYSQNQISSQICGAMKNVIAIAAGIIFAKNMGQNAIAALLARGLNEMAVLAEVKQAQFMSYFSKPFDKASLMGLSGAGDLFLTASNPQKSRNSRFGYEFGSGKKLQEILENGTYEGYFSLKVICEIAKQLQVELPICNALYDIIYKGSSIETTIDKLFSRELSRE